MKRGDFFDVAVATLGAVMLFLLSPIALIAFLATAKDDAETESWAEKQQRIHQTTTAFVGTALWIVVLMTCAGGHR